MPGEELDDALAAAAALKAQGVGAIFTRLGENLTRAEEAESVTRHYLDALDRIDPAALGAHISVKPTQLGLDFDEALCLGNLRRLVDKAAERDSFVWIDMESSAYVDRTLDLFRRLRAQSSRVGIALQAYLRRTASDLESLLPLGPAVRIVKGAYLEPASIAFPRKGDVDESFYKLACRMLGDGPRPAGTFLQIATHDERLVNRLTEFIDARDPPASSFELAMLYGIQRPLQARQARAGRPLRVLIAYGDYWFQWYMRRLAERPANVWFVIKSLFAREIDASARARK
jgi:proline dehydrogenase